jgi:hypothetical protein
MKEQAVKQFFEGLNTPGLIGLGIIVFAAITLAIILIVNDAKERRSGYTWSSPWDHVKPEDKFSYEKDIKLTPERKARWLAEQAQLAAAEYDADRYDEYANASQDSTRVEIIDNVEVMIPVSPGRPPLLATASVAVIHEQITHMRTTETTFIYDRDSSPTNVFFTTEPVPFVHPLAIDPQDDVLPWWHRLMEETDTAPITGLTIAPMPRPSRPVGCHHLTEAQGADSQRALTASTGQFDTTQLRALLAR